MKEKHIIIIGAGVIGLSSAYYLNKKGFKVTVLDNTDGTDNCSYGNAGLIVPDHIVPLASPGIISQGLRWMLRSDSPFYIKPKINRDLIKWGLKFRKAATKNRVDQVAPFLNELLLKSRQLQGQILKDESIDAGFNDKGLLVYFNTQEAFEEEITVANKVKSLGQKVDILDATNAKRINPEVEVDIKGAILYKDDASLTPHVYMGKLKDILIQRGVDIRFNQEVDKLVVGNSGNISAVEISNGNRLEADEYVLAAGAWSKSLLKRHGIALPMQAGKGYSFVLPASKAKLNTGISLAEARVVANPMLHGVRFAGTMEINGMDLSINNKRVSGIVNSICKYFPQLNMSDFEDIKPWAGFRPCSPDGLPYIGRTSKHHNLIVATGHAMLGMTLGPVTGLLTEQMVSGDTLDMDISLIDVNRYN